MEFQKQYIRAILYYHFIKGSDATSASKDINSTFQTNLIGERAAQKWYKKWKDGQLTLKDDDRSGRPNEINDEDILKLITENSSISTEEISSTINYSETAVRNHLHALGYVSKLDKWVPHTLSKLQMDKRVSIATELLQRQKKENFLSRVITVDEKWIYFTNHRRSRSWKKPGDSPEQVPKKTLTNQKVLITVFWWAGGIIHVEYLPSGKTINSTIYSKYLTEMKKKALKILPSHLVRKGLILHQDNAKPHTSEFTKKKLKKLEIEIVPHPPFSPDLAFSDFHLFRSLQNYLQGKSFTDSDQVKKAVDAFFCSKNKDFYRKGIEKVVDRWEEWEKLYISGATRWRH